MSGIHLFYAEAKQSPHYQALVEEAVKQLQAVGTVSHADVLKDTGLYVFRTSVNWPYVRKMIEEQIGTELIPLAATFFRREGRPVLSETLAAGYIAIGQGKKTAGYALASEDNGHLVVYQLERKRAVAEGTVSAANRTLNSGVKGGVTDPKVAQQQPYKLPIEKEVPPEQITNGQKP